MDIPRFPHDVFEGLLLLLLLTLDLRLDDWLDDFFGGRVIESLAQSRDKLRLVIVYFIFLSALVTLS